MRDFKNFMEYVKILAALHFALRPKLQIGERRYIVSQLTDFVIAQKIIFSIFETTTTSLSGHVLDFYHKVLLQKETWESEEAVEAYNKISSSPRSSSSIRDYFEQLSKVGYVDIRVHPTDKRKNLYIVLKREKWENARFFKNDIFSDPELKNTVKKWLEKYGKNFEFYIERIDDIGTIHESRIFSDEDIVENIL